MGIFALPRVKSLLDAGYKVTKLKQKYNYFMLRNIFPSFLLIMFNLISIQ